MIRIITYAVLLVVFLVPGGLEWLLSQDKTTQMFVYHFFHGNIFHLLANGLALYFLLPKVKPYQLVSAYVIASFSPIVATMPVVGISNIVYAIIGLRSPSFKSAWWRHYGTITFLVVTLLMLFFSNIAAVTHIVCFACGVVISVLVRWFKKIGSGSERYI